MSFNCQVCGKHFGYSPTKKVQHTRVVKYDTQVMTDKGKRLNSLNTEGFEIASELNCCNECANTVQQTVTKEPELKVIKSTSIKKKRPSFRRNRDDD